MLMIAEKISTKTGSIVTTSPVSDGSILVQLHKEIAGSWHMATVTVPPAMTEADALAFIYGEAHRQFEMVRQQIKTN